MSGAFHLRIQYGLGLDPLPADAIDAIESVKVTVSASQRSGFQVVFAASRHGSLLRDRIPSGFLAPMTRVVISVAVNGTRQVLMDGVVTRHEAAASNEPGKARYTVTGEDLTVLMDLVDLTGIAYPMPTAVAVRLLMAPYLALGIVPAIAPTLNDFTSPLDQAPVHEGTTLAYLQKLARESAYVFYLDPGPEPGMSVAYFGPEIRHGTPQPALTMASDGATNVDALTVSVDGMGTKVVLAFVQEPNTRAPIPVPIPQLSILKPPLAALPIPPTRVVQQRNVANKTLAKAILMGGGELAAAADPVTANGSLDVLRYGRVLKARALVGVRGAGLPYDGLWYVTSVTHEIGRGKYKQSFQLGRGGVLPVGSEVAV